MNKALVVLSGGQDSTTCLYWAIDRFGKENIEAIGFDYGQRHKHEISVAHQNCVEIGIPYTVKNMNILNDITVNALTRDNIGVNEKNDQNLPATFVDGRNLIFLSVSAIYAKSKGIKNIVTGVCETDFSGYPDCRDIFIKSLNVTLNLAMGYEFAIHTPLMWLNKMQTWEMADKLGCLDVIKHKTITCYNGIVGDGCGDCPACKLRIKGYNEYVSYKKED